MSDETPEKLADGEWPRADEEKLADGLARAASLLAMNAEYSHLLQATAVTMGIQ